MNKIRVYGPARSANFFRVAATALLMGLAVMMWGCGGDSGPAATMTDMDADAGGNPYMDSGDSSSASGPDTDTGMGSSPDMDSGVSSSASGPDTDSGSSGGMDTDVVSRENPGFLGAAFDEPANSALFGAEALDLVNWTEPPAIVDAALVGAGELQQDANLFAPSVGEGAAFMVFYKGHEEPMVALLPDLGPMMIWETDHTVAEMEYELAGTEFSFRAYSPLFMDTPGPGELELHTYGFDEKAQPAVLSIVEIN